MKKVSTAVTMQSRNISVQQKLTIGLDLGDRNSWYCVLDEAGPDTGRAAHPYNRESVAGSVRRHAAQPDSAGNRDPFALDQSPADRVRTRSDCGQCSQGTADRGKSQKRRSAGCADARATGADRSPAAVSSTASQCAGASGFDDDSSARRPGASTNGAGQRGAWSGEVLRRTTAWLQRAQHESGKSRRVESRTATGTGAVAFGNRRAEPTDLRVQRTDRSVGAAELSAGGAAEADQGRGHADRTDVSADAGRSASFPQEPRRGLLSGATTRTTELGAERAAEPIQ
jgi:hypothetical protein